MLVVLPAPFGPRKPVIFPGSTLNDRSSTASVSPYRLVRPLASIMSSSLPAGHDRVPGRPHQSRRAPASLASATVLILMRPQGDIRPAPDTPARGGRPPHEVRVRP